MASRPDHSPPSHARVGRPRSQSAESHAAIMDAVHTLLQQKSARELTMDAVAKLAGVGKPTLYKWWPSKASLIMAMFSERFAAGAETPQAMTAEASIRARVKRLISEFNGSFGKVMAELIAEGQSEPAILSELYEQHIRLRRASTVRDIERGKATGELPADADPELLIDALFAPIYYRLLLRNGPLTQEYGDALVSEVFRGLKARLES